MKKKSVLRWFLFSLCMIFCTIDTLYGGQKEKDVVYRKNHVFFMQIIQIIFLFFFIPCIPSIMLFA